MQFTLIKGKETGDASPEYLYSQQGKAEQVSQEELQEYFESKEASKLRSAFGSFDNYLGYMTEREGLIADGSYDTGNWAEQGVAGAGLNDDQEMLWEGDADLTVDLNDPMQDITNINRNVNSSRQNSYNNWANSDANQALLEKYGVNSEIATENGSTYRWNGSGYVKTETTSKLGDYAKMAMGAAVGWFAGPALGGALGTGGGVLGSAANSMLSNAISQGIATGSLDARQLMTAGITGGLEALGEAFKAGELAAGSDAAVAFDNALWDMADTLGTDYDTVLGMVEGIAGGAIAGQDLEEIAIGAVGDFSASKVQDWFRDTYADSMGDIDVDNWFEEGSTAIPAGGFDSLIDVAVGGALGEGVSSTDLVDAVRDYFGYEGGLDAEGNVDFADVDIDLPDFDLGDTGLDADLGFIEDTIRDVGSEIDDEVIQPIREAGQDFDDEVLQPIKDQLPQGETPDIDLPDVDVDLPDVSLEGPDLDIDGPDLSLDTPDVNLPSFDLGGGMMGGGGASNPHKDFYSGINYRGLDRPTMPIQPVDNQNGDLLNELIVRNLGGSLFKG